MGWQGWGRRGGERFLPTRAPDSNWPRYIVTARRRSSANAFRFFARRRRRRSPQRACPPSDCRRSRKTFEGRARADAIETIHGRPVHIMSRVCLRGVIHEERRGVARERRGCVGGRAVGSYTYAQSSWERRGATRRFWILLRWKVKIV